MKRSPERRDRASAPGGKFSRRDVLAMGATAAGSVALGLALGGRTEEARAYPLRPPSALGEDRFSAACIGCFQCGSVCPNQCIKFRPLGDGIDQAFTPYIEAREQACVLCMRCTQACPTTALTPIANDPGSIAANVRMGTAFVDKKMCYSYNDRICGVCYYACPFPDTALRLGRGARPIVDEDHCVGCGNCERICIHLPQAVRVIPASRRARS